MVAVTCLVMLAAALFPRLAEARRQENFARATVSLKQIGAALAQYQADHDTHIPIRNYGYLEPWEDYAGRFDPADDPLAKYGLSGYETIRGQRAMRREGNPYLCPGEGHRYDIRWVFSIRQNPDEMTAPDEVRRVEPDPTTVLVRCPNLLVKGYRSGTFLKSFTEYSRLPATREGRELLLRGDGSVSNVDTKAQRLFMRKRVKGQDTWRELNALDPDLQNPGQLFEAFPGETWPPRWTVIAEPLTDSAYPKRKSIP